MTFGNAVIVGGLITFVGIVGTTIVLVFIVWRGDRR